MFILKIFRQWNNYCVYKQICMYIIASDVLQTIAIRIFILNLKCSRTLMFRGNQTNKKSWQLLSSSVALNILKKKCNIWHLLR